jgi:hypothetical protein
MAASATCTIQGQHALIDLACQPTGSQGEDFATSLNHDYGPKRPGDAALLAILYAIDSRTMSLPLQAMHTQQPCRLAEVTFRWSGAEKQKTVQPNNGDHYKIVRGNDGVLQVEPG